MWLPSYSQSCLKICGSGKISDCKRETLLSFLRKSERPRELQTGEPHIWASEIMARILLEDTWVALKVGSLRITDRGNRRAKQL